MFAANLPSYSSSYKSNLHSYDWSFVGAVHSDRLLILDKLLTNSSNFFLYIYFPSIFHWLFCFLRYPMVLFRLRNFVSFRHLSSNKLASVYASSRSVIDINHPNQSGLTMRCVESLVRQLLTSNANITNEYIYDVSQYLFLCRSSPYFR